MATKGGKKTNIEASEAFLQYEEEIIENPAYAGMPDLYWSDGRIQWEAPSNRAGGEFKETHDKRLHWWTEKAKEIGISTTEDKWISKTAKRIHPTGVRPCKVCGNVMEIRYAYLDSHLIKRIEKLSFFQNDIELTETTHILDFITAFVDSYGDKAFSALSDILRCKAVSNIPKLPNDLDAWINWVDTVYIPAEPKGMLGPGAMSNAPDRLDGFHTFNRCCRKMADKGRSKENLASYSKDRRAFENWSDGNWITANALMGFIKTDPKIKKEYCANYGDGHKHSRPCDADHIGPISLGFCHRPEFQLLCSTCNSAKNNRIYYSDVQHLIKTEAAGTVVTTWYATPVWDACKHMVSDKETALRLARIMRDNRNIALMLLCDFMEENQYLFLLSLLNLDYADYEYSIVPGSRKIENHIVTVEFKQKKSTLKYVNTQKRRKIRVAFEALKDYSVKDNRNGYMYSNSSIVTIKNETLKLLKAIPSDYIKLNTMLANALKSDTVSDSDLDAILDILDYPQIASLKQFKDAKENLTKIMSIAADNFKSNWNDARYSRD